MSVARSVDEHQHEGRDFCGIFTQYIVGYLRSCTPEGTIERILAEAGEKRPVSLLNDAGSWSSYAQYRGLVESMSAILGGPSIMAEVGHHAFDSIESPELSEALAALGSPAAVYAALPAISESTAPLVEIRTQDVGPNECRISLRVKDGYEPMRGLCAFHMGLFTSIPLLFGLPDARVVEESCQCDGAPWCQGLVRWEAGDEDTVKLSRAEMRARLSEARLEELQRTVAELVSGDGLEPVLTLVLAAAGRAVQAQSYILDVRVRSSADRWLCAEGIAPEDAARIVEEVRNGAERILPMCVAEVASDRNHYGHLVVIRPDGASFEPLERSVLESYARLAASALDSEAAIVNARQQATAAEALLSLSSSLADLSSPEEMVFRLARAVPSVIDCDRVAVWLLPPGSTVAEVSATYGFDPDTEARLRALAIPALLPQESVSYAFRHHPETDCTVLGPTLAKSGSVMALSFPITYNNEVYGWITVDVTAHPERLDEGTGVNERFRGLAAQAATAIRNVRLLDEIRHQALHDSLTGLPNRALVVDRVNQSIARARREHLDIALMFIDLDGFKDVNDNFGHGNGDRLLQAVATRFASTLRDSDTIARLGGDEFVVLAEGVSIAAGPELLAERLLAVLAEPFRLDDAAGTCLTISASIGIAVGDRETAEEFLRDADIALYEAKGAGRNCFRVFHAEMQATLRSRHELEMDLQAAIGSDQFFLLYQPIFDLHTMSVVAVEALLRWHHPTRGLLAPDDFLPALESSGLIIQVGRWVLHEACGQAQTWRQKGHTTKMSVNISARQLDANSVLTSVAQALESSGLKPSDLIIEITETSLMRDTKGAQKQLTALKALGVRIAIDDFGTGYSSLAYLQQFPVDSLKIDRSFIAGMAKSPEGDALIHTLMQLGQALHLETLAEGIEEAAQLNQLQSERCDVGQGYLFARPLSADDVEVFFDVAVGAH